MTPVSLRFDRGSLTLDAPSQGPIAQGPRGEVTLDRSWRWDPRVEKWRAPAIAYRSLVLAFHQTGAPLEDQARAYEVLELTHLAPKTPHVYQREALQAWRQAARRGLVVLPTGAGKTYVAELAIQDTGRSTLVVSPTIDLMNQWYDGLSGAFAQDIGLLGGGYHELQPLTVTTYDSAYLHLDQLGDRFALLIFDECHHLPSPSYAQSAEWAIAPYRLGLTATPERQDGGHQLLETLIGPLVFRREIDELAGEFLADYEVVHLEVELDEPSHQRYVEARETYRSFLYTEGISMGGPDGFRHFLIQASRSQEGRQALKAFRLSRELALAAPAKLEILERLMLRHRQDRMLIFAHENKMVYEISRQYLVPCITHHTPLKERKEILQKLREGTYRVVATSRVLNEGVNLPSVSVGVILSGTSSVREHVQRLGRLLRRQPGKEAVLYEVVTRHTLEERVSERRREHSAYRRE